MRNLSNSQLDRIYTVLVEDAGAVDSESNRYSFVYHCSRDCQEYRFMGSLGFGGKFRNNGNRNDTPYVDQYRENETSKSRRVIERVNEKIKAILKPL